MTLPVGPYQSPNEPLTAAVHNAGHVVGCYAAGLSLHSAVTGEVCRGTPLGLKRVADHFSWALICWTGPAAEAVLATRSGTPVQHAAEWIWAQYRVGSSDPEAGSHPEPAEADPAVLAVALSVADANWKAIERISTALAAAAQHGHRMPGLSPRQVGHLIGTGAGEDIAGAFGIWEPAMAGLRESRRQAAGNPWS